MVASATVRSHGQTTAEEEASERGKGLDTLMETEPERPVNLTRAFQRLRTDWNSADRETIDEVRAFVDQQITDVFSDAFLISYEIYDKVRERVQVTNIKTGEMTDVMGTDGLPEWRRNPDGSYVEDWSKIHQRDRDRYLYLITTRLFEWEQSNADIWGEALFAKAQWEEAFATGFDSISDPKATVDARAARANRLAAEHRYLAVFKSMYSKKAEAVVRSMSLLGQRFKDLTVS